MSMNRESERVSFHPQSLRTAADVMEEVPFPDLSGLSSDAQDWYQKGWKAAIACLRAFADEVSP